MSSRGSARPTGQPQPVRAPATADPSVIHDMMVDVAQSRSAPTPNAGVTPPTPERPGVDAVLPLVGRDGELAVLLDAVRDPHAVGVVVGGDAGVGKTRLLTELVGQARAGGTRVLVGHCLHFGGDAVAYLPISEAFGRLSREETELSERLRADLPPVDRLLPQHRVIGAADAAPAPFDLAGLFDAVRAALVRLADDRPVLLVIEDLHWADGSTRDLMGYLFARLAGERVTVVASYRSDDLHRRHPLRPALVEWARVPGVLRLPLVPLADDGMRRLLQARHPGQLDEAVIDRILDRAGGNAFYAEQLLAEADGSSQIPADLAELVLHRLERLSPSARRVVRIAAVSGRRVSHRMLAAVSDIDDAELDLALREAVDERILDRSEGDGFAFRHALLAEAVYDDLLPGERVRLHRTFAAALSAQQVAGTDADLARHAREAMDLPLAFAASVRAGDEAMRVAAPSEAMAQYEAALELVDSVTEGEREHRRPELTLRAAEAAVLAGHSFRALNLIQDALGSLPADAPVNTRVDLLVALAAYALPLDAPVDFFAATSEALRLVPAGESSPRRARVLAVHARASTVLGRDDDGDRWARLAIELGRTLNLPDVIADASTTLALLDERADQPDRAIRVLEESVAGAEASGELTIELRGLHQLGDLHYDRGELTSALTTFERAMARADAARRPWSVHALDCRILASLALYVGGEWDRALGLTRTEGVAPAFAAAGLTAAGLSVRAGRGELDALDDVDLLRPWWPRDGLVAVLTAGPVIDLLSSAGRLDDAIRLHDEVVTGVGALWQNTWFQARIRLHTLLLGALAAAVVRTPTAGRPALVERGSRLADDIRSTAQRGISRQSGRGPEGIAWLARGDAEWARLRWAAGVDAPDAEQLIGVWVTATDAFAYGNVFEQARSRARSAAARRAVGDASGAQQDADAARAVATRLGAVPLLSEIRELGGGRRATGAGAGPVTRVGHRAAEDSALTPRETQVLGLIADGRTNRQIGRSLYISDKTVSVHVSNILAKLGAGGRTEAAAIARRDGLLFDG